MSVNHTAFVISSAAVAGTVAWQWFPFPVDDSALVLVRAHNPWLFRILQWTWNVMLFSTPAVLASGCKSLVFIFARGPRKASAGELPPCPLATDRDELRVVLGEVHQQRKPERSEHPGWLAIPERGLFTGIAVFGAIGSGKTSACLKPYARQILSWRARDPQRRIGGIVLEVKGDFCHQIRGMLKDAGREEDYIEISLSGKWLYNPLVSDLDAFALAYSIASLLNNLYGRGKEPFWQQAYTNLVKFCILLHKVVDGYVTLFDVYECAIRPKRLAQVIERGEALFRALAPEPASWIVIDAADYLKAEGLQEYKWEPYGNQPQQQQLWDQFRTPHNTDLEMLLAKSKLAHTVLTEDRKPVSAETKERIARFEACRRWFIHDWMNLQEKLRTSVVEGISVFLSMFDENPHLKRVFCPPKECYDAEKNADGRYGTALPSFSDLIESGKVVAINFPAASDPAIARTVGAMLKLDFQRAMLTRIPKMAAHPEQHFREALFLCDEYQSFATVGESDPTGDEKFFALARQAKCIAITATQSISSLRSVLPGESWRTLLQTFRTKLFLSLADDFSAKTASELCGRDEQLVASYSISESGQDVRVSTLTGKAQAHKAGVSLNKTYRPEFRPVFEPKVFGELPNAMCIAQVYDGTNQLPPQYLFLKPAHLPMNMSWFDQRDKGMI